MTRKFAFLLSIICAGMLFSDTLYYKGGIKEGYFVKYDTLRIYFRGWKSDFDEEFDPTRVEKIEFDEPIMVHYSTSRNGRRELDSVVRRFSNGKFNMQMNRRYINVNLRQINRLTPVYDPKELQARKEAYIRAFNKTAKFNGVTNLIEPGKVTAIYFFDKQNPEAEALGNWIEARCIENKEKCMYREVAFERGLDDAMAKSLKMVHLPQVWIFSDKGAKMFVMDKEFTKEQVKENLDKTISSK